MNKKLHILFLSSWYPSRVSLTNGNFVQKHAEAIATKHHVTVVFPIGDNNCNTKIEIKRTKINNVDTIIVYFKKNRFFLINAVRKFYALKSGLKLVENFDIIHGNILNPIGLFVWLISIMKKKPYIFTEHWTGYLPDDKNSLSFLELKIVQFISKRAKFIVPVSLELQKAMKQLNIKGNFKIIGNVVNTKLFHPTNNTQNVFTIVHISTFIEAHKNLDGILRTIKMLTEHSQNFVLKIIGTGSISSIEKKVNELQIPKKNIILEGIKTSEEIAEILQQANVYISFSNFETFGIVMTESIACGTPVISTNTGILNDFKPSQYIKIIHKNNKNELLEAILKFKNSKMKFDSFKMYNSIEKLFGIKSIANKYNEVYQLSISSFKNQK